MLLTWCLGPDMCACLTWLQAGECRRPEDIQANLGKAMKAAITDGARARIVSAKVQ